MRILVTGDTHGDTSAVVNIAMAQAKKLDCTVIFIVGDFGYWEHFDEGRRYLDKLSKWGVKNGLVIYFLDGNHDNHPLLWSRYPVGEDGLFAPVREGLFYVPRGTVWEWGGVRMFGMGGAYSIDKPERLELEQKRRNPRSLWWPTETITHEQVQYVKDHVTAPVDIMFSHDCPTGIDIPGIHAEEKSPYPLSWENRYRLREIFEHVEPRILIHGHYHVRYSGQIEWATQDEEGYPLIWQACRVEGLSYNGKPGFMLMVDTDTVLG